MQGSELGIASMVASLVLAAGTAYQWIDRVDSARRGRGRGRRRRRVRPHVFPIAQEAEHAEPFVEPVIRKWVWWQSGGFEFGIGEHIDGLRRDAAVLVAFISTLVQIYSTEYVRATAATPTSSPPSRCSRPACSSMVLAENMVQLILGWEIMGLCSFMLIGHWWEERQQPGGAEGVLHGARRRRRAARRDGDRLLRRQPWATDLDSGFNIHAIPGGRCPATAATRPADGGASRCSSPASASPASSRCTPGCPTRWPARHRCRRCCTRSTMVVAGVFLVARLYPVFFEGLNILGSRTST